MIIEPQFDWVGGFRHGIAHVKSEGKCGFIDTDGRMLIQPQFDEVLGFSDVGLSAVKIGDKWAYIDRDGKFLKRFE